MPRATIWPISAAAGVARSPRRAFAQSADERAARAKRLPVLGAAPELRDTQRWFNTEHGRPLTLRSLRGRVVLLDFWTYSCINCIRTLPALKAWDSRYRHDGLTIIGLHAPEFPFERDAGNVERAIGRNGLRYAVAQDNDFATWDAWGNQYWPAKYLIDAKGHVRYTHFGEGEYDTTEESIRKLLEEAGKTELGATAEATGQKPTDLATPETYLGSKRAERFLPAAPEPGTKVYDKPAGDLPESHFALSGEWTADDERALAGKRARLYATVTGKRVFLVMSSEGDKPRKVEVLIDGKLHRTVTVSEQKLYTLASLPEPGTHSLELRFEEGVAGYAFTFG